MRHWFQKLTSRKFIMAALSAISGIAVLCGADENIVSTLAGAAMTLVSALVYCITEGRIDAASIKQVVQSVSDAAETLGASDAVQSVIDRADNLICGTEEEKTE